MAESIQQMMQNMHSIIQSSMIAAPAGSQPESIAALEFPGVPVDPAEFADGELPVSLQTVLDTGLALDIVRSPTGSRLFSLYGQILQNAKLPKGSEPTPEERRKINVAREYIRQNTGRYINYSMKMMNAQWLVKSAKTPAERQKAQMEVRRIDLEWNAHNKGEYEAYANTIRELQSASPSAFFESARQVYMNYSFENSVSIFPAEWYADTGANLSWTAVECGENSKSSRTSSKTTSTDKTLKEYYKKTDFWSKVKGWFGVKSEREVSTKVQEVVEKTNRNFSSCHLTMSWEMMRASVQRPWLDLGVLAVDKVQLPGVSCGAFSSGKLSRENKGMLPGYITDLIVARNIVMDMCVSREMADIMKDTGNSVTCGPFCLGGERTVQELQDGASSDGGEVHLRVEVSAGKQIIGYILAPFPRFPTA